MKNKYVRQTITIIIIITQIEHFHPFKHIEIAYKNSKIKIVAFYIRVNSRNTNH